MTFSQILAAILFLNFEWEKDKIELGMGQIWNQRTKLCKSNCMPNSTKKCLTKSEISEMGPDYIDFVHCSSL